MKYNVKYIYGRYEIQNVSTDYSICTCYSSENASIVCEAMNQLCDKDIVKEKEGA